MNSRTILLSLHIAMIASWLGADTLQYALRPRWAKESMDAQTAWARMQFFAHNRYYAVVAVLILITGLGLVFDGDWSWGSNFIYVGIAAIVLGGLLGGVGLKGLAKKRLDALEAGDMPTAEAADKRALPIEIFLTAFVLVTILAMVTKWGA